MQEHPQPLVREAALRAVYVCSQSAPAIVARTMDKGPDVRVAAYDVIRQWLSPKVLSPQIRAFLCMEGMNHKNSESVISGLARFLHYFSSQLRYERRRLNL